MDGRIEYVLSFDWAPRTHEIDNLASSQGAVSINNQKVADLSADALNSGVKHSDTVVFLEAGSNTITFAGLGASDSYGVSISNVVLRRRDGFGVRNVLVNGDFSSPYVGNDWQYVRGGISGWSADVAEIGYCKIYNNLWQGGQCIELDTTSNQSYTQNFTI